MTPLLLVGLFVAASAAPQFYDHHPHFGRHRHLGPYISNDMFLTQNFWNDLTKEFQQLDDMLNDFYSKFPSQTSRARVEGNEYKVTIPLSGFDEKDIIVKARDGMLMIQAVHKREGGGEQNYFDVRTLPDCVNVTGSWTYENSVLDIVFPLKAGSEKPEETTESVPVTEGYKEQSREEMETNHGENNVNADVGLDRGDQEVDTQVLTNEIPRQTVEATTYAVDLKGEVEFVPIKY